MLKSQNVIKTQCHIFSIKQYPIYCKKFNLNLWEELTLHQACTNFGLISLNLAQGQEQSLWLSQSVYFVTTKGGQGQFLGESYPINVPPKSLKEFVAAVATVHQESHFKTRVRTEGQ